ncbi:RNA-binding protein RO60 [Pholidichthys leucotaenia]
MESSGSTDCNHTLNLTGGGGSWEISDKVKLCRFLCYGSEEDVYSTRRDRNFTIDDVGVLLSMLQEGRGVEVVEEIKWFSQEGKAVKLDPSIFALALCSQHSELKTRQAAFKALKEVCLDPAHLFAFIHYKKSLREEKKRGVKGKSLLDGIWGRAPRKALSDWYNEQDAMSLAVAVTKCKKREGWSHQDLLRLSHSKPGNDAIGLISKYLAKGWKEVQVFYADKDNSEEVVKVLSYLEVVEKVKHSRDVTEVITLIEEHKLEKEQLLTEHLKSREVWSALLKEMPLDLMLRMLGNMTSNKFFEPGSSETEIVCDRIQGDTSLKKAKIHPFSILLAIEYYKKGQGYKGKTKWEPNSSILEAMDSGFYKSFMNVEPVGKCFLVAVDVSTLRNNMIPRTSVSSAIAAAAITLTFARTESNTHVLVYSEGAVVPCLLSADMTLQEATAELVKPNESTDCTLPLKWATENGKSVDVFIILTNNPLLPLTASPVEALKKYRQTSGAASKLVICDLTAFFPSIQNTEDRGILTICDFDLGAFSVIRNFAQDLI